MTAIIDKIRKLLALSKSSNANEAAAAAAKAQRLMTEHQVAEAELEAFEAPAETASVSDDPLDRFGLRVPLWKELLSAKLATLHGCRTWKHSTWTTRSDMKRHMRIAGRPSDVASVRYLYAWLTSEIERMAHAKSAGRGRDYAKSYRLGAVQGCIAAMREANGVARAAATPGALVRLDARIVEANALLTHLDIADAHKPKVSLDGKAFDQGSRDGRGLHTGAKLTAVTGARLLGDGS